MKRLTRSGSSAASVHDRSSALVLLGDPQSTKRAIAWVLSHLGPGQKPLVWASAERSLRYDAELEAFSKCAAIRTPDSWATWHGGPVLALWPDDNDLDELARDRRVSALCVLGRPNQQQTNMTWTAATGATVLTSGGQPAARPSELHPVVVEALQAITGPSNSRSHLGGSTDRQDTVVTLTTLRHGGYRLDPGAISAWAVAHAWLPGEAKRLGELAAKIQAGVAVRARGYESYPRPELLRLWRERAIALATQAS